MASIPSSPGTALFVLRSAGELALLGATFFAAGRRAAGRLSFRNAGEEIGVSLALGAGICGTSLFLLAAAGELTRAAVIALSAGVHAIALPVWRGVAARVRRRGARHAMRALPLFPVLLAVPSFCLGLYPSTGFDETLYHLPMARSLSSSHSLDFLVNLRNPVFPELVESLDAAMMLLFGDVSTHLVECLALIAIGFALCGFARRWGTRAGGVLAAAFFAAHVLVLYLGAGSCVDLDVALFFLVAYFAWEAWRETDDRRWLAISAVLAGFAAGTKYLGLFVLPLLAAVTFLSGPSRKMRRAAFLIAIGAAVLSPWYLWIFAQTGNPVFPLLPRVFGHNEWEKTTVMFHGYASPGSAWTALVDSARGIRRGTLATGAVVVSPLLFVELALAATGAVLGPIARRALLIAVAYGALLLANDMRFLFPSLALVAFAAALGLESLRRSGDRERPILTGLLAPVLAVLMVWPAFSAVAGNRRALGPVPTSSAARSVFLRKWVPGYGAIAWLNARYGDRYSVYALWGESLAYFAEGNFMGDFDGPYRFAKVRPLLTSPLKLGRTLRAFGAEFLALNRETVAILPDDFRRHFRRVYSDGAWTVWQLEGLPVSSRGDGRGEF